MPISQKTVLVLLGLLADLSELSQETLAAASQGDLLTAGHRPATEALNGLRRVDMAARKAHLEGISVVMADDKSINVNPITGRAE